MLEASLVSSTSDFDCVALILEQVKLCKIKFALLCGAMVYSVNFECFTIHPSGNALPFQECLGMSFCDTTKM